MKVVLTIIMCMTNVVYAMDSNADKLQELQELFARVKKLEEQRLPERVQELEKNFDAEKKEAHEFDSESLQAIYALTQRVADLERSNPNRNAGSHH